MYSISNYEFSQLDFGSLEETVLFEWEISNLQMSM